ncbi:hypothetical protein SEA_SPILLED_237 [Streptomyces phage Spilled]|uniref:Uncharacterized protein n=4 Tax=root TaxID=1 RepID=A0A5Q2WQF3_9CAUD|nr:hypothetical protein SEA_STARBOW_227 [Streptomyces phage Starbow]QDF17352.1 hypothetical protein SEA_BIRCHLYN_229 [Streptomyces phage Birchlyn]QFP97502.1 hypothetical protein SEA_ICHABODCRANE_224 [Streptomyces phage IchabodCrane]QGH74428.1 hypothetical protein SEA_WIPEOUT_220 [Streptomyces phage Wipeout]QGH79078.1 hypothetical protein SEA_TOMSAWYER_234 [Streptomyces phage TomSawyer]QGH79953.1 hypothetical protein SEA_BORDEAUX_228 [Streptomyces phage Bordeaux]QPL13822.1 hypothetical protein
MGFWSAVKDIKTIVALEEAAKRSDSAARYLRNVQEWDCFEDLVLEWKRYFEIAARKAKVKPEDLKFGGKIFDEAMNLTGKTPPAKRSGGNATARAKKLCDKYGRGDGPSFGAAMAEGLHLAQGGRSNYRV